MSLDDRQKTFYCFYEGYGDVISDQGFGVFAGYVNLHFESNRGSSSLGPGVRTRAGEADLVESVFLGSGEVLRQHFSGGKDFQGRVHVL